MEKFFNKKIVLVGMAALGLNLGAPKTGVESKSSKKDLPDHTIGVTDQKPVMEHSRDVGAYDPNIVAAAAQPEHAGEAVRDTENRADSGTSQDSTLRQETAVSETSQKETKPVQTAVPAQEQVKNVVAEKEIVSDAIEVPAQMLSETLQKIIEPMLPEKAKIKKIEIIGKGEKLLVNAVIQMPKKEYMFVGNLISAEGKILMNKDYMIKEGDHVKMIPHFLLDGKLKDVLEELQAAVKTSFKKTDSSLVIENGLMKFLRKKGS